MSIFEDQLPFYVQDKLPTIIRLNSKQKDKWNLRCPICGDSKKSVRKARGWYYLKTNSFYCFNCETSCSGIRLLSVIQNVDETEVRKEFFKTLGSPKQIIQPKEEVIEVKKKESFTIPDNWLSTDLVDKFIKMRKLDEAPFKPSNWNLYFDKSKKRIVIPWIRNGQMRYYQLRAILPDQEPKYLFPPDTDKDIFGLDSIDDSLGIMFLLEGALDSVFVKNGIAIGGTTMTAKQETILEHYLSEKVLMLDNQNVDTTAMIKLEKIAKEFPNKKLFIWPKNIKEKDVNEYYINHGTNPFADISFLKSRIFFGLRALLEMKPPTF